MSGGCLEGWNTVHLMSHYSCGTRSRGLTTGLCSPQLCCTSREDKHQLIASEARKNNNSSSPSTPSKLCGIGVGLDPVLLSRNQGAIVMSMAENGALYADPHNCLL